MPQPIRRRQYKTNTPKFPQHQIVFDSNMEPLGIKTRKRKRISCTNSDADLADQRRNHLLMVDKTEDSVMMYGSVYHDDAVRAPISSNRPLSPSDVSSNHNTLAFSDANTDWTDDAIFPVHEHDLDLEQNAPEPTPSDEFSIAIPTPLQSRVGGSWPLSGMDNTPLSLEPWIDFTALNDTPTATQVEDTLSLPPTDLHSPFCQQSRYIYSDDHIGTQRHPPSTKHKSPHEQPTWSRLDQETAPQVFETFEIITEQQVSCFLGQYHQHIQFMTAFTRVILYMLLSIYCSTCSWFL